jgi:hypothetical protein
MWKTLLVRGAGYSIIGQKKLRATRGGTHCDLPQESNTKQSKGLVLFSWDVGVFRKGHAPHLPSAHIPTHKNPNLSGPI